jgi:two-component system CheB/CheR fusion protein
MRSKSTKPILSASSKQKFPDPDSSKFPIVGIGASAGGLDALEQFLGNVPENCGMAFVVIQHLDPTQKGMLPELLQRITRMEVFQAKDRMRVKPGGVYVIPPNKSMSILKGMLHLFEPLEIRGLRLPIDFFLHSLAEDMGKRAIGLILSGMGSDGSAGLRAIKEKNGIVIVQDPVSAQFDSMPRHAIDSVIPDLVAPPNELPQLLFDFLNLIPSVRSSLDLEIKDQSALEKIVILLRSRTGNDFSLYKKNTVYRRIERRMSVHKIDKISSYVRFLQENPKEIDILFKELLIGVTNFFRDGSVWEKMHETMIGLFSKSTARYELRAWVPGCSTGEEAYSLAILFKEALDKIYQHSNYSLQIFATDLDNDAIETARKGLFPSNITADVSPYRLKRFFIKTEDGYRVNTEIREMIVFATHNVIMHPPFTKIDILSCRNLLIYLDAELQKKLLGLFYYSINPDGILLLGSSETLGTQSHFFSALDSKLKIYLKSSTSLPAELFDFPAVFSKTNPTNTEKQMPVKSVQNIQTLAEQLMLQQYSPAGVLVNENGDIIYISGRTGKYLEPAVGKANLNIFAMLRDGLRNEFPMAFRKTILTKEVVILRNIKVGTNGGTKIINVTIQAIEKPEPLNGMVIIIFSDVPDSPVSRQGAKKGKSDQNAARHSELEDELQRTREEIQIIVEEMQTSQEELKSANEELQSTNEELQSTNEELTTSKEEMQSLNEELQTVNAELQSKVDDFSRVNNDMKNLLNSTDIATLFLDKELKIRRYTIQATKIFKLIKSDIGRPFTDLVSDLIYPGLAVDAQEVLQTLVFIQKQIATIDNRWLSVRIMPYRTFDDRIDGLVITFINITELKQAEVKLQETLQMNRLIIQTSDDIIIKLSTDYMITMFNPAAEKLFGKKRKEIINQDFFLTFIPEKSKEKIRNEFYSLPEEPATDNFSMQVIASGGKLQVANWSVNKQFNSMKQLTGFILITKNPNHE